MKLWLDDVRPAPEGDDEWVTFTRPWPMLLFILKMGDIVTEWSLDHDLGLDQPTGYDLLEMIEIMLANGCHMWIPDNINVHSANPVGVRKMEALVKRIKIMEVELEYKDYFND